jgi:flagellar biosynthetic protein FlhB/flagellar biosynthesis protein
VAIKYDRDNGGAPKIVAKGMRKNAETIKEIARQAGVPILRNVPLAQALSKLDLDEEIPEELYEAVAEVLNFVYELREKEAADAEARRKRKGLPPKQNDAVPAASTPATTPAVKPR